ncbi:hypothetical protein [Amycolatopsis nivea]|uniref:hypothetical protein n=1 Tax=Amycolatopsis nivea TaxID=1644109 RepID=UPI00107053C3|nr:hypothetical protein [Amycolatopsis nivea]
MQSPAVAERMPSALSRDVAERSRTPVFRGRTAALGCPPSRVDGGRMGTPMGSAAGTLGRETTRIWVAWRMGRSTGLAGGTATPRTATLRQPVD